MLQIFVRTTDLIPTEGKETNSAPYKELADKDDWNHWKYTDWLEDIRKNGIKYALKVAPDGRIKDGNFRYWSNIHLGIEYTPIDLNFLIGLYINSLSKKTIRTELVDHPSVVPLQQMFTKNPIIPPFNVIGDSSKRRYRENNTPLLSVIVD